jgi:hypothetical protein
MGFDVSPETEARPGDPMARYRTWATAFIAILFLGEFAVIAVGPGGHPHGPVILVGSVMGMVILGLLLLALDTRRPWALDAATRVCLVVVVLGSFRTLLDLGFGRLTVPIDVIGAIAVLSPASTGRVAADARSRRSRHGNPRRGRVPRGREPPDGRRVDPDAYGSVRPASLATSAPHSWLWPAGGSGGPS